MVAISTRVTARERIENMSEFRLTIWVDEAQDVSDDPLAQDSLATPLFKLHSFNRNDTHFTDPDSMICAQCDHWYIDHDDEKTVIDDGDPCNNFTYPEGYWLSHYEHGQRHWSIQGTVHYPDMQWDGVRTAGYLEVVVPDDEREWWDGRPEEDKLDAAKATIAEYTSWINGEVYGYTLENTRKEHCDKGFTHVYEGEDVSDVSFGIIGWEWLESEIQMATKYQGATAENTEIVDKAYGMADNGTFFKTEVSA